MRVLLIKLTSLGDVIHALPALSDAAAAVPGIVFDWMIDENFQEVATWHPSVDKIYTTNHRTWRKGLLHPTTVKSIHRLRTSVNKTEYDLVIDGQGNFKTALFSLMTRGPKAGFDSKSVREWVAHLAYQRRYAAPKKSHAIDRLRRLFASALGYPLPLTLPQFSLKREVFTKPECDLPNDYLMFIHNASWKTKLWPEEHWISLIKKSVDDGFSILLPWGNSQERERAERLAISSQVQVLPKLRLSELAYLIERAKGCVTMDTGLSHLIAALNIPSVSLYGATNAGLIGAVGTDQTHLISSLPCSPCEKRQCALSKTEIPCLKAISPDRVYSALTKLLPQNLTLT